MRNKRSISRILIIAIVFSLLLGVPGVSPYVESAAAATFDSGRVTATFSGTTLTINCSSGTPSVIPENAFASNSQYLSASEKSNLSKVTNIVINGNIYEIGRYAFTGCVNATSLTINSSAKPMNIKLGSFYNCKKLTRVTVPSNVTHIQAGAFDTTKTQLSFQDSRMQRYTTSNPHGYKIYDTLTFNAIRNYSQAFSMLSEINKERANKGVAAVSMTADLLDAAMVRAFEISLLFSHTRPNGEKFHTIIHHPGSVGENIASGGTSATAAMTAIKRNGSNEVDITNKSFKTVGVGCAQINGVYYWVQLFSSNSAAEVGTTNVGSAPTNKTVGTAIDLPLGTNAIVINGSKNNLAFSIDSGNTGVALGGTKTLNLQLSGVQFARSSGTWSSDDTSIVSVDGGKITGKKMGKTTVRAGSQKTNRASISVRVYERVRVAGNNRYGTSIAAADKLKSLQGKSKFDCMIIAFGDNFADALSATYLAAVKKAPIILVNKSQESNVANYVRNNLASGGKLYLIGGTAVVSQNLENSLRSLNPVRLAGANRFGTNLAILREAGVAGQDVLICTGKNYADSLSASSVGKPIMLIGGSLNTEQISYLKTSGASGRYYLIGGTFAVPDSVTSQLRGIGGTVQRVAGNNRYGTSLEVAKKFFSGSRNTVVCVYAMNYPDGLSGGPIAVQYNSPVLLVSKQSSGDARSYAQSVGATRVVAVGGSGIIPDESLDNVGGY